MYREGGAGRICGQSRGGNKNQKFRFGTRTARKIELPSVEMEKAVGEAVGTGGDGEVKVDREF